MLLVGAGSTKMVEDMQPGLCLLCPQGRLVYVSDFIARHLILTANRKAGVRRRCHMRLPFEVMYVSRIPRVPRMHMRQCREVSRLTSCLLLEALTFGLMVLPLRAGQMVLRWNLVGLCPGSKLPIGAHFFS